MAEDLRPEDVPDDLLQLYGRNYNGTSVQQAERSALAAVLTVVRRQHAEELERLRAKLAALDELHPLVELSWYHPCRQHSMMDEQAVLDSCPDCTVTTYMGCPRCDDDCEIRAIIHPEDASTLPLEVSKEDTTDADR